jgi:hypothetical protein
MMPILTEMEVIHKIVERQLILAQALTSTERESLTHCFSRLKHKSRKTESDLESSSKIMIC